MYSNLKRKSNIRYVASLNWTRFWLNLEFSAPSFDAQIFAKHSKPAWQEYNLQPLLLISVARHSWQVELFIKLMWDFRHFELAFTRVAAIQWMEVRSVPHPHSHRIQFVEYHKFFFTYWPPPPSTPSQNWIGLTDWWDEASRKVNQSEDHSEFSRWWLLESISLDVNLKTAQSWTFHADSMNSQNSARELSLIEINVERVWGGVLRSKRRRYLGTNFR